MSQEILLKPEAARPEVKELLKEVNPELSDENLHYDTQQSEKLLKRLSEKMNRPETDIKTCVESVSYNSGKAG